MVTHELIRKRAEVGVHRRLGDISPDQIFVETIPSKPTTLWTLPNASKYRSPSVFHNILYFVTWKCAETNVNSSDELFSAPLFHVELKLLSIQIFQTREIDRPNRKYALWSMRNNFWELLWHFEVGQIRDLWSEIIICFGIFAFYQLGTVRLEEIFGTVFWFCFFVNVEENITLRPSGGIFLQRKSI